MCFCWLFYRIKESKCQHLSCASFAISERYVGTSLCLSLYMYRSLLLIHSKFRFCIVFPLYTLIIHYSFFFFLSLWIFCTHLFVYRKCLSRIAGTVHYTKKHSPLLNKFIRTEQNKTAHSNNPAFPVLALYLHIYFIGPLTLQQ